jgi:hypothetical protein
MERQDSVRIELFRRKDKTSLTCRRRIANPIEDRGRNRKPGIGRGCVLIGIESAPADWSSKQNSDRNEAPTTPTLWTAAAAFSQPRATRNQNSTPERSENPLGPSQGALQLNQTNQLLYVDGGVIKTSTCCAAKINKNCM